MFKYGLVFIFCFSFIGCAVGIHDLNEIIPKAEFKSFEYHRSASGWDKDIEATNSKIDGNGVVIESLTLKSAYPGVSFSILLEGYKRKLTSEDEEKIINE